MPDYTTNCDPYPSVPNSPSIISKHLTSARKKSTFYEQFQTNEVNQSEIIKVLLFSQACKHRLSQKLEKHMKIDHTSVR